MTERHDGNAPTPAAEAHAPMDHRYDGIEEFDNPMPAWWVWTFWGSFLFSLGYLFHFWIGTGVGDQASYEAEMVDVRAEAAQRALGQKVSEEALSLALSDKGSVSAGRVLFEARCQVCHGPLAEGLIGPNLTDDFWIHGRGTLLNLHDVIAEGVLDKGMPAWSKQLQPTELRQVIAYVGSVRGTHLAGKEPQGELVK